VEAELGAALETLLGEPVQLTVAGRTDAGVHALAQVVSLESEHDPKPRVNLRRALNGLTGNDLVVSSAEPAPDGFDARGDARSRTYCYRLLASSLPNPFERGLSLWWPYPIEPDALDACVAELAGTHDFTAFTPTATKHVHFERRILRAEWIRREGGLLELWIEADAFLHGMVRALVGTMLEVAGGRRELDDFRRLLAGAPREQAGDTAKPHGLYLAEVRY
jgi:tRNA pseudouridine38-40 synthase